MNASPRLTRHDVRVHEPHGQDAVTAARDAGRATVQLPGSAISGSLGFMRGMSATSSAPAATYLRERQREAELDRQIQILFKR